VESIPGLVRIAVERYDDAEAVVDGCTRVSYAELGARVERAAACLASGVADDQYEGHPYRRSP
jgi:non-ribosomal peptide synthetase component E (peptide arylation enzyme)